MNPAMNESAMRDQGRDDKGEVFFHGLSQDQLDVFVSSVRISRLTAADWTIDLIYLDYVAICGRRCVISVLLLVLQKKRSVRRQSRDH